MCNIEISLLTLEIDDASGKTYLLLTNFDRKLTGEKEKKNEFKYGDKYFLSISVCFRQIL